MSDVSKTALEVAVADFSTNTTPTDAQLDAWKTQYGKVKVFAVGPHTFAFKQPTRDLVKMANAELVKTKSPDRYSEVIIKNTLLNGQALVASDDEIYFALQGVVDKIVTSYSVELKNE
jgi:hypothetical protein